MALRKAARAMEVVWRGSASWGAASDIFTHNYPSGNYVSTLRGPAARKRDQRARGLHLAQTPASSFQAPPARGQGPP